MTLMSDVTFADLITSWDAAEIWRPLLDWPYEVSSWGNVRREDDDHVLIPGITHGYGHVTLSAGKRRLNIRVHRAVAYAFLGRPSFPGAEVAHNDGVKSNARASNLRWASKIENQADRVRHKTDIRGSDVAGAKLHESEIPEIVALIRRGESYPSIAAEFGVSISTVSLIKQGRIWRHVNDFAKEIAA